MATTTSKVSQVGNNYYKTSVTTNADGSLSSTTYRTDAKGAGAVEVSKVTGATATSPGTRTPGAGATAAEQAAFANPNSPERKAYSQQVLSQKPYGTNPTAEQSKTLNNTAGKSNTATNTENGNAQQGTPEEQSGASKENDSFKEGTRKKYDNVHYPEKLSLENQDCIKFSILEYKPSLAAATGTSGPTIADLGRPKGKTILGSITLPIPAGINDSNQVSWQSDTLNLLQQAGAAVGTAAIQNGVKGAEEAVKPVTERLTASTQAGELQRGFTGLLAGMAVNSNTIQQRAYGSTFNNNLELLFNGPSLRSFSFNFKLSPRNANEAKTVMTIIRYFKQAMSVKRSQTTLLLKTPRTFAISYLTSNKEHPYLNKFKECALTSFNVNYTPEGQYMTYMSSKIDERSMISYEISLTFEELEPIFDDEYSDETPVANIGY